jgi:putative copper export protein
VPVADTRGSVPSVHVLSPSWTTARLFLHVLGAAVWVGGQIVLAGLVPGLRRISPEAPSFAARRFNVLAWSAFGLLLLTGVWNLFQIDVGDRSLAYQVTLGLKLVAVALTGVGAFLHAISRSRAGLAVWGSVAGVFGLVALFLGELLTTGA